MQQTGRRRELVWISQCGILLVLLATGICHAQSHGGNSLIAHGSSAAQSSQPSDKKDAKEQKGNPQPPQSDKAGTNTKLNLIITGDTGKPVGNAVVYVRFPESGGFLRHQKLAELDLKTNEDGKVKVPEIPRGRILIQVIAKGWHTYGKWYEIETASQTVEIKLEPPPHWY